MKIENGVVYLEIPLLAAPRLSRSGDSYLVAQHSGALPIIHDGKVLKGTVSVYFANPDRAEEKAARRSQVSAVIAGEQPVASGKGKK